MTAQLTKAEFRGLIRKYDRPGPRYTSYPTAVEFHDGVGPETYAQRLRSAAERPGDPLSLYLHLPFCRERCWYCGCNVVVARRASAEAQYREALLAEVRTVARMLGERRRLSQLHWGGGTPTYGPPDELLAFHREVLSYFPLAEGAEVAFEVDPRVTTSGHLEALAAGGFNRLSVGVQDFEADVQEAIGRRQDADQTARLIDTARRLGFGSINVDLIYGLPKQTLEGLQRTLARVRAIRPERVAIYGYAHLPDRQRHQQKIDATTLPDAESRLALFELATEAFAEAGYVPLGLDHFATPEDELARAAIDGRLDRNFMGYTVRAAPDTIACGLSAIGDVAGAFVQNEKHLARYQRTVLEGGLPTIRGCTRTPDDELRRDVITGLMVNQHVDRAAMGARHGVDFDAYFADELDALAPMEADGLVLRTPDAVQVTDLGRRLVRNVAMVFDAYRQGAAKSAAMFSRTV